MRKRCNKPVVVVSLILLVAVIVLVLETFFLSPSAPLPGPHTGRQAARHGNTGLSGQPGEPGPAARAPDVSSQFHQSLQSSDFNESPKFPKSHKSHESPKFPDSPKFPESPKFQAQLRAKGLGGRGVWGEEKEGRSRTRKEGEGKGLFFTHDDWPQFGSRPYKQPIPRTPFNPPYVIQWDYNTSAFLQRPDVQGRPPKLITWYAPVGYLPDIPQPVRLRTCPEMPCRLSTNRKQHANSAAVIWNAQAMTEATPPRRASADQVYIFHNQESPTPGWIAKSTFTRRAWRSAFNWTMSFRLDSDIVAPYGFLSPRPTPPDKNYTAIVARKTKMAAWLVSHCRTQSRREDFVKRLQQFLPVDVYGGCGPFSCARSQDECQDRMNEEHKFYLGLENTLCPDYFTEKLFRYLEYDFVVVVRGGQGYQEHVPPGTYVNADDFGSVAELAAYLHYLDQHPEEYIKILRAKDRYVPLMEEYPHRDKKGRVTFVHYHYEAVAHCELCRRLWDLDTYSSTVPDIMAWFHRGDCSPPMDLH